MQSVTHLADLRLRQPACLTIGAFDGVHRGHQALMGELVSRARATERATVVVTFYPHPSVVLRGRRPSFYITAPEAKVEHLAALGVDAVVTLPFNERVAETPAGEFVAQLVEQARMSELWCGEDFALGHNREGTVAFLRAEGERLGFAVRVADPVRLDGEVVSSTRVRQALRDGAVEQAARLLGRPFSLSGRVVEGARRGRTLGIPTANLAIWDELAFPGVGVYACRAHLAARPLGQARWDGDAGHAAVVNIGYRPTFETGEAAPTIEAHILDYSGDLYQADMSLEFVTRLRPEMKFPGIDALVAQIQADIAAARQVLDRPAAENPQP